MTDDQATHRIGPIGADGSAHGSIESLELEPELARIDRTLEALGALERDACDPGLSRRVQFTSASALAGPARAAGGSSGTRNPSSRRFGGLAAAVALLASGGAAWLAVSTGPGTHAPTAPERSAQVGDDTVAEWFALEEALGEPVGSRLDLLKAETAMLERDLEASPLEDFWLDEEGAL